MSKCSFGHDGMGRNTPEGKATIARETKCRSELNSRSSYPKGRESRGSFSEGRSYHSDGGNSKSYDHSKSVIPTNILNYGHNNPDHYAFTENGKFKFNAHYEDGTVRIWYPGAKLSPDEQRSLGFQDTVKRELFTSNQKIYDITNDIKETLSKIKGLEDMSISLTSEQQHLLNNALNIIENGRSNIVSIYMRVKSGGSSTVQPTWMSDVANIESNIQNTQKEINTIHAKYVAAKENKEKLDKSRAELEEKILKDSQETQKIIDYVGKCAYKAGMDVTVNQDYVDIAIKGLKYSPYKIYAEAADYAKDVYGYSKHAFTCYEEYQNMKQNEQGETNAEEIS